MVHGNGRTHHMNRSICLQMVASTQFTGPSNISGCYWQGETPDPHRSHQLVPPQLIFGRRGVNLLLLYLHHPENLVRKHLVYFWFMATLAMPWRINLPVLNVISSRWNGTRGCGPFLSKNKMCAHNVSRILISNWWSYIVAMYKPYSPRCHPYRRHQHRHYPLQSCMVGLCLIQFKDVHEHNLYIKFLLLGHIPANRTSLY